MVLAFFSEHFQKASRDKTEYNDMQMKHSDGLIWSTKGEKNGKKGKKMKKNGTKKNLK